MFVFLFFPFVSTLMVVLNVYNGDILGIESNIEYILWYIPLLIYIVFFNKDTIKNTIPELSLSLFGIIFNFYWIYAWKHDKKTNYRHRTEYYDTQCLLCAMSYTLLVNFFKKQKPINNRIMTEVI